MTTISDSTALDTLIKTQSKSRWHVSISGHKHFEIISNIPYLKSSLSRLKMSVEPGKTIPESNLGGQKVKLEPLQWAQSNPDKRVGSAISFCPGQSCSLIDP